MSYYMVNIIICCKMIHSSRNTWIHWWIPCWNWWNPLQTLRWIIREMIVIHFEQLFDRATPTPNNQKTYIIERNILESIWILYSNVCLFLHDDLFFQRWTEVSISDSSRRDSFNSKAKRNTLNSWSEDFRIFVV